MKLVQSAPFPTTENDGNGEYASYRVTAELNGLTIKCQFVPAKGTAPSIHTEYCVTSSYASLHSFHKEKKTSKTPPPMVVKLGETELEILHAVITDISLSPQPDSAQEAGSLHVKWGETEFHISTRDIGFMQDALQNLQIGDAVAFTITHLTLWEQNSRST